MLGVSSSSSAASGTQILRRIEPFLALYKALELRQRAGLRTFLPRTLSYRCVLDRRRGRRESSSIAAEDKHRNKRKRSRYGIEQERLDGDERSLRVTLVGVPREALGITPEFSSTHACVYLTLYAQSDLTGWRLIEAYQLVVPIVDDEASPYSPGVDVCFEYDFKNRKESESISLVFHVYPIRQNSVEMVKNKQIVKSDGEAFPDCEDCRGRRGAFRESFYFQFGVEEFPYDPPHSALGLSQRQSSAFDLDGVLSKPRSRGLGSSSSASAGTAASHSGHLKVWNQEEVKKGRIVSEVVILDLDWSRSRGTGITFGDCCPQRERSQIVREDEKVRERRQRSSRPTGVRSPEDVLPVKIQWQSDFGEGGIAEVLREFYCPICRMFCGSWDGLLAHGSASHIHFTWTRDGSSITIRLKREEELRGILDTQLKAKAKGKARASSKSSWEVIVAPGAKSVLLKSKPLYKFVHTSDGFRLYEKLEDCRDVSDAIDDSWLIVQDTLGLEDFEDISLEEKQVMLMWNTFVRTELTYPRRMNEIDRSLLDQFVRKNASQIKQSGLVSNIGLLFLTLYDFGLISNDDVLAGMLLLQNAMTTV